MATTISVQEHPASLHLNASAEHDEATNSAQISTSPNALTSLQDGSAANFERLSLGVLFLTMLIFLGGTFFMTHKRHIPLPYTVVLFLYGIVVGVISLWIYPDVADAFGSIPPNLLFYIFLPVLIFEGSYAINIHALRRVMWQTVLLATVGVVINTIILGSVIKLLFLSWSWYSALLLGTLLSATDPVSVVALLKNLKVENALTAMVEGESVLNDGTAIIAFTLLLPAAHAGELTMSGWGILGESFRLSLLPLILGPIFGLVQLFWLRKAYDGLTRACITVSVTYVSYYVAAELIGTSGVLTLFIQGIFLSNACPSLFPGREGNQIYATWEFLVHLGNTVLFSMVGVILVADVIPTLRLIDIVLIVVVYLTMLAARWMMLEALLPLMNQFAYKMNQRKVLLMVHAGLRGGVATTLALAVKSDGLNEGITMLKITAGVVLLSLVLNGSTAAYVVGLCGFRCKPQHRVLQMGFAMDFLVNAEERTLDRMKRDTKYRNASWLSVEKYVDKHLRNPFRGMHITKESDEVVVNRLLMSAFKASLWRQRDEGVISETVVHSLGRVLAKVIDRGELLDVREMELYHKHRAKTANSSARSLPQTPNHAQDEVATTNGTKHSFDSPDKNKGAVAVAVRGVASSTSDDDDEREMTSRAQELSLNVVPGSPSEVGRDEASSDLVIDSLMRRLLPRWVVLLEHVFGHGYFEAQHRRAQENAFMTLLALAKCLSDIGPIKYKYTQNEAQARRVEEWMGKQVASSTAAIRFFYSNFPEATNNVSSSRAVLSVANHLLGSLKTLRTTHGFNAKISDMLNEMIADMRDEIPMRWDHDVSKKESDLVRRAVAATTLGKGLRRSEIQAISSMGLVKKFRENDTIKLPENAFLVVVFGSLRALHGSWTTVNEHELMESYGDTVGLESFLLPKELRKDQQREWRVVSTEATALLISFNSISPFLSERSLRSVKALWRAAAVEVILPILADMITLPPNEEVNTREHFIRVVMNGTPLIGPQDCRNFDWRSSQLHLCFYLRGCDKMGMFNGHTPPCYISTFYAHQLEWEDHEVVLYAVPVNVSDHGYIPWVEEPPRQLDTPVEPAHGSLDIHREDSYGTNLDTQPSSNCLEEELDVAQSRTPERAAKPSFPSLHVDIPASPSVHPLEMDLIRTHAAATTILNSVLQGSIPLHPLRRHEIRSSPSMWEADDPQSPVIVSPTPSFSTRLTFSAQVVCILQNVEAFVTPVPFVNQLLAQYAAVLEQLCVAAVRYVREPNDPVNLRHAQRIAETALEFLLGFSVQLALVKRAIGCLLLRYPAISREASFSSPDIRAGVVIEEEDSVFQCKVCAWMRLASLTRKYHLKTITTEMNSFANCRFGGLAQTLKRIVVMEPGLKRVESVEGMYALIKRATDAHEEAPDLSSMSPI